MFSNFIIICIIFLMKIVKEKKLYSCRKQIFFVKRNKISNKVNFREVFIGKYFIQHTYIYAHIIGYYNPTFRITA